MTPDLKTAEFIHYSLRRRYKANSKRLTANSHLVRKALSKKLDLKFYQTALCKDNSLEYEKLKKSKKIEKMIQKKRLIKTLAINSKDVGSADPNGLLSNKIQKPMII